MFFNSLTYPLFLTVATIILFFVPGRYQWCWLLVCSIIFYYTLVPAYLILFSALVLLNYYLGIAIERSVPRHNFYFIFGVFLNILVLAFFKYFGFFNSIFNDINELTGNDQLLKIILPVGLSFLTFTILSYLIEVKRGTVKAERHFGIFAASLLFFPKVMQGPIEKPDNIFPQFREVKSFNYEMVSQGMKLMLWGYFKKLVVANRLALYVNAVYGNYEHHSGISLIVATIFYSIQIYADFSGYTDIALGSAKVLGFNLTNNFKRPYLATTIKEFWSRWHISFSVWLRDYLFLPLAVFFTGKMKKTKYIGIAVEKWIFMFATLITFIVCGIWHGEGLNFIMWGLVFGFYLVAANSTIRLKKRIRKKLDISKSSFLYMFYCVVTTFILVSFAWIFFRADSLNDSYQIIKRIFSLTGGSIFINLEVFFAAALALMILFTKELTDEYVPQKYSLLENSHSFVRIISYANLIALIILFGVFDSTPFLYFQF